MQSKQCWVTTASFGRARRGEGCNTATRVPWEISKSAAAALGATADGRAATVPLRSGGLTQIGGTVTDPLSRRVALSIHSLVEANNQPDSEVM